MAAIINRHPFYHWSVNASTMHPSSTVTHFTQTLTAGDCSTRPSAELDHQLLNACWPRCLCRYDYLTRLKFTTAPVSCCNMYSMIVCYSIPDVDAYMVLDIGRSYATTGQSFWCTISLALRTHEEYKLTDSGSPAEELYLVDH